MNRYIPYFLVLMSVVFSVFGMHTTGLHWAKIAALAAVHLAFVKLLSGTLQSIFDEAKQNTGKAVTLGCLGITFAVFDVWLVHFGLALMLVDWPALGVYGASIAFCAINIFAHWAYTPSQIEEKAEEDTLGNNVTRLADAVGN